MKPGEWEENRRAYKRRGTAFEGESAERVTSIRCADCQTKNYDRSIVATVYLVDGQPHLELLRATEWGVMSWPDVTVTGVPLFMWMPYAFDELHERFEVICRSCRQTRHLTLAELRVHLANVPRPKQLSIHPNGVLTLYYRH